MPNLDPTGRVADVLGYGDSVKQSGNAARSYVRRKESQKKREEMARRDEKERKRRDEMERD